MRAVLLFCLATALAPNAYAQALKVSGQLGVLGEWELSATLSREPAAGKRQFSGPLTLKHVGICSQDGPEEKAGTAQVDLVGASRVRASFVVVCDAGMLRLALEDRLKQGRALELVGVGLVGRRSRDIERNRIGDLRLVVLRIALRERFHRLQEGLNARAVFNLVVIGIEEGERVDVVALALGLRAEGLAGFDRCRAFGEVL